MAPPLSVRGPAGAVASPSAASPSAAPWCTGWSPRRSPCAGSRHLHAGPAARPAASGLPRRGGDLSPRAATCAAASSAETRRARGLAVRRRSEMLDAMTTLELRLPAGRIVAAPRPQVFALLAALSVGLCVLTAVLVLSAPWPPAQRFGRTVLHVLVVAVPMATGLYAIRSPRTQRFGYLLLATGAVWSVAALAETTKSLPYSIGRVDGWLIFPVLIYLMLAFPRGRLTAGDRRLYLARHPPRRVPVRRCGAGRRVLSDAQPVDGLPGGLPAQRVLRARLRAGVDPQRPRPAAGRAGRAAARRRDALARQPHAHRDAAGPPHDRAGAWRSASWRWSSSRPSSSRGGSRAGRRRWR